MSQFKAKMKDQTHLTRTESENRFSYCGRHQNPVLDCFNIYAFTNDTIIA